MRKRQHVQGVRRARMEVRGLPPLGSQRGRCERARPADATACSLPVAQRHPAWAGLMSGPGLATLEGTGLVADDLYLMAHHETTGRPYLHPRALGLGLAGGLLAELVLSGHVRISQGEVAVATGAPPRDELARIIVDLLCQDGRYQARDWLTFLARTSTHDVALRLERAGYVAQAGPRRRLRAPTWVPVDADCAFAPLIRVRAALDPGRPPDDACTALAGLAAACGLGPRLLPYGPPGARRRLDNVVRCAYPGVRDLITQVQAAVDAAVLSHRR